MSDIKTIITTNVKPNGKGEITGEVLQGVLVDMVDDYNEVVTADVEEVKSELNSEIEARKEADETLQTAFELAIDNEAEARKAAIESEADARYKTDTQLYDAVVETNKDVSALDKRVTQNTSDIATNASAIAQEVSDRKTADTEITQNTASLLSQLSSAMAEELNKEATTRKEADDDIVAQANIEVKAREDADALLQAAINSEVSARSTADTALQNALLTETNERKSADTTLQSNITAEETARKAKDTELQADIDNRLKKCISTTYAALKALRDASGLVAGQYYRITDYQTTTTQAETRSAGHQFDVIVRADASNALNEQAWAAFHYPESGAVIDTYFDKANLSAWRLSYCLDNDTKRFAWADTANGKGVIYRMIDEYNNDLPYDFKNIQFKVYEATGTGWTNWLAIIEADADNVIPYRLTLNMATKRGKYTWTRGTGFIWAYTFSAYESGATFDKTMEVDMVEDTYDDIPHDNRIGVNWETLQSDDSKVYSRARLNLCVWLPFFVDSKDESFRVFSNEIAENCHDNIFGRKCYGAKMGISCYGCIALNNCHSWTCGNNCYSWTCGNKCHSWTCGNTCYSWTCGNNCSSWTCGNNCYSWTCGNNCSSWTCGNYCFSWACGNTCYSWTCGNYCYSWSCGNECYSWECGNYCYSWECGNYCRFWKIGTATALQPSARFFHLGAGVRYVYITASTTPTSAKYLQNFVIKRGAYGTSSSYLSIVIDSASFPNGSDYEWTIAKNSSGEIKQYCEADLV